MLVSYHRLLSLGMLALSHFSVAYASTQTPVHVFGSTPERTSVSSPVQTSLQKVQPETLQAQPETLQAQPETLQAQPETLQAQKVALGSILFHDTTLSNPPGQSCATCHQAEHAFADPRVVSEGATKALGTRNAPTLMYAKYATEFHYVGWRKTWIGGQFWDGREDSLALQALGPLFNPVEMNNTPEALGKHLRKVSYANVFEAVYGSKALSLDEDWVVAAADALQAFQMSEIFSPFTSKFDYALLGLVELTEQEKWGRRLFDGKASCIDCHAGTGDDKHIFTFFSYHNILTPPNPAIGDGSPDKGAANNPKLTDEEKKIALGRFKTPTMRNITLTAPYMHNGIFKTLREVMDYYNNMEDRERWGPASFPENQSHMLRTKLDLTEEEIEAIIAFLHTLTDGYALPTKPTSPDKHQP